MRHSGPLAGLSVLDRRLPELDKPPVKNFAYAKAYMGSTEPPELLDRLPEQGRLLGIDYGTVRMGLALCDESQRWVTPLDTYHRRSDKLDEAFLTRLLDAEYVTGIVLGLPIHSDGRESPKSLEVRNFRLWLARLSEVPCVFQDERFTTAEAQRLLKSAGLKASQRKKRVDRLAAQLILEHFLESRRYRERHLSGLDDDADDAMIEKNGSD